MNKQLLELKDLIDRIGPGLSYSDRLELNNILGQGIRRHGVIFCDPLDPEHGG